LASIIDPPHRSAAFTRQLSLPFTDCGNVVMTAKWRRMNARAWITMDAELHRRARARAAELGISFAEYVRRLLASDLGEHKGKPDISIIFDLCASGEPTDIARDKDKMIGEAVWEDYLRKTGRKPRRKPRARQPRVDGRSRESAE
jgi:hypothetical protein